MAIYQVWKQVHFKLECATEKPKCECCGHVFSMGETCWVRQRTGRVTSKTRKRGNPKLIGYEEHTVYRCQKCYELMWY